MQFADVLASTIHDIKNSLSMVMITLDDLMSDPANQFAHPDKVIQLQQEAKRANNDLIQLLMIYKHKNSRLAVNVAEHNVEEFFEDILVEHQPLLRAKDIALKVECDPELFGFFDDELVRGVVGNTIDNAARYTKQQIHISAVEEDGYLVFRIEDDGVGYPQHMLETQSVQQMEDGFSTGNTHLGLYFSLLVAETHKNKDRAGSIKLENNQSLPGGCFSLRLP